MVEFANETLRVWSYLVGNFLKIFFMSYNCLLKHCSTNWIKFLNCVFFGNYSFHISFQIYHNKYLHLHVLFFNFEWCFLLLLCCVLCLPSPPTFLKYFFFTCSRNQCLDLLFRSMFFFFPPHDFCAYLYCFPHFVSSGLVVCFLGFLAHFFVFFCFH